MDAQAKVICHSNTTDNKPYTVLKLQTPNNFNQRIFLEGHQFTIGKKVQISITAIL